MNFNVSYVLTYPSAKSLKIILESLRPNIRNFNPN